MSMMMMTAVSGLLPRTTAPCAADLTDRVTVEK